MISNASSITRRNCFAISLLSLMNASKLLANSKVAKGRLGICSFSCHRHWQAVRDKSAKTQFVDGLSFFDYAHDLGADGVQTSVGSLSEGSTLKIKKRVESVGGYFEGDVRIPNDEKELERFERDIILSKQAGADLARSFLSGSRRYETWKTREAFLEFRRQSSSRLAMVEPILAKHRFRLAIENHKDFTTAEMVELLDEFHSEWLGVNVDTGNNIALLEDPYEAVERLAPYAFSVHLKDMALQPHDKGFELSEMPCGQGYLDLGRIVDVLIGKNSQLNFSLEMATRDPLIIPCLTDDYWTTFEHRDNVQLERAIGNIKANLPKRPPPSISGKSLEQQLIDEEHNNRISLAWLHANLR
jgi:3-oxoisoapionate decarboxylase